MARAEASWGGWQDAREAHVPRGSVTSEQRSQTPQIASARRVALLFGLSGVASQSQTHEGYAPSSRLAQAKNHQQRGSFQYFNSLLRESLSLHPFAVNLINAHEAADEIPVLLIGKRARLRRPNQLARRLRMIRIVNQIAFVPRIRRKQLSLIN